MAYEPKAKRCCGEKPPKSDNGEPEAKRRCEDIARLCERMITREQQLRHFYETGEQPVDVNLSTVAIGVLLEMISNWKLALDPQKFERVLQVMRPKPDQLYLQQKHVTPQIAEMIARNLHDSVRDFRGMNLAGFGQIMSIYLLQEMIKRGYEPKEGTFEHQLLCAVRACAGVQ